MALGASWRIAREKGVSAELRLSAPAGGKWEDAVQRLGWRRGWGGAGMGGQTALAALALAWAEGRTGGSCAGVQGLPVLWQERALSPRVVRAGSGILRPAPRSGAFVPALRTEGPEHCLFLRIQMSLGPHPPVARMGRKSQRWLDICSRRRGGGAGTAEGGGGRGRRLPTPAAAPPVRPGPVRGPCPQGSPGRVWKASRPHSLGLCCCGPASQLSKGQASPCGLWMGR